MKMQIKNVHCLPKLHLLFHLQMQIIQATLNCKQQRKNKMIHTNTYTYQHIYVIFSFSYPLASANMQQPRKHWLLRNTGGVIWMSERRNIITWDNFYNDNFCHNIEYRLTILTKASASIINCHWIKYHIIIMCVLKDDHLEISNIVRKTRHYKRLWWKHVALRPTGLR